MLDVAEGSAAVRDSPRATDDAVAIATDQPGHTPVRFLGHDLSLSSGAARIAQETNVPVAVVTAHPDPGHPDGCGMFGVAEPLSPDEFDSRRGPARRDVRSPGERHILAWPEAREHPLRS